MGKRIFFQIYPGFLLVIALTIIPTAWFATRIFREFYLESLRDEVLVRANMMNPRVAQAIGKNEFAAICDAIAKTADARVTVINPQGSVLYDSEGDYEAMPDHSVARPEMKAALIDRRNGVAIRYSSTLLKDMLYAAEPLFNAKGELIGVLRLSLPVETVDTNIGKLNFKLVFFAFILAVLSMLLGLLISRRLSRPIENIRRAVDVMANGNLDRKIHPSSNIEEINALADAVNSLAVQLKLRISDITSRKNELGAILSSMKEGVIAVDSNFKVIIVNRSAAEILNLDMDSASGHTLYEVLRNPRMQKFAENILASRESGEEEIECTFDGKRILVMRGSIMIDEEGGEPSGAVIVIGDVTRMRRLEEMRRDFVANVSHEIKTPVTAIKASVEALEESGADLPEPLRKFLQIIERHADRLEALVSDVLSLSALESNSSAQGMRFTFKREKVAEILATAKELCRAKAEAAGVVLELDCPKELEVVADSSLLEQAVMNLIDNAVKYSPSGSSVRITGKTSDEQVEIRVTDHGCGIDSKEHERIFERFYRVDKARSRKLGGTGLGLSIVKHIVLAHEGTVHVESEPGQGASFVIELPLPGTFRTEEKA